MTQKIFAHLFTMKTLIRVAFAVLSLNGIAHAATTAKGVSNQGTGGGYNFMAGGGG